MSKLVIFSEFYYPRLSSSGYFITEIAEHLALKSEVFVVCVAPQSKVTEEEYKKVKIIRIPDIGLDKNSLIKRPLKFLLITLKFYLLGKQLLNCDDKVICLTNPAFSILGISRLKKKIGFHYSIMVHDVFPENLIGAGIIPFKGLLYFLLIKLFNRAYKLSDRIIVLGRDMKELFVKKLPGYKGNIMQISNWGDPEKIYPSIKEGNLVINSLKIKNNLIFQFSGNLGRAQGIKRILSVSDLLLNYNIIFLFFGEGALKQHIEKQSLTSKKVIYGGTFQKESANLYLNACDVAIISLKEGMKGLGVPSKTYDIMAAGKPILFIGPEESEIGFLIREENIGWVVNQNSDNEIANKIKQIFKMGRNEIELLGMNARKVLLEKYTKKIILSEYEKIFG